MRPPTRHLRSARRFHAQSAKTAKARHESAQASKASQGVNMLSALVLTAATTIASPEPAWFAQTIVVPCQSLIIECPARTDEVFVNVRRLGDPDPLIQVCTIDANPGMGGDQVFALPPSDPGIYLLDGTAFAIGESNGKQLPPKLIMVEHPPSR